MSATLLDVNAVRSRFTSLQGDFVFLDAPGGSQVPDEVGDAIARTLREASANVGAPYETSYRVGAILDGARATAGRFLGCSADEVVFGANMTTLNFMLTRTASREWTEGDELVVTRLDHDGNVAPWLELAHDLDLHVRLVELNDDTTLDLDDLESKLSERTRVVAFPLASNGIGTVVDGRRVAELAHSVGALAWADAVHFGPHVRPAARGARGPRDRAVGGARRARHCQGRGHPARRAGRHRTECPQPRGDRAVRRRGAVPGAD